MPPQIEEYMEFLKGEVTEEAANTFTEEELNCPVSGNENLAMVIHQIEAHIDRPGFTDATDASIVVQLAKTSQVGMDTIDKDDILFRHSRFANCGATEGTLSEYQYISDDHIVIRYFDPPVLWAKSKIYMAIKGTNAAAAKTFRVSIGYTIRKVSKDAFIAALVS